MKINTKKLVLALVIVAVLWMVLKPKRKVEDPSDNAQLDALFDRNNPEVTS